MEFYQNLKFGIIGGGQLGRMLIQAGLDLNLQPSILDPDPDAPCAPFTRNFVVGSLTDYDNVYNFGKGKDLLTIEIENVNIDALFKLQKEGVKVYPQPEVIKIIQDKRLQKEFYKKHKIPTAEFKLVKNKEELQKMKDFLSAFQKLGRSGYDGRGVQKLNTIADLPHAFEGESLLEKMVDFEKELSVIIARNENGEVVTFPVVEMVFHPEETVALKIIAGQGQGIGFAKTLSTLQYIQKKTPPCPEQYQKSVFR